MIGHHSAYTFRRFMKRNQDFVEHVVVGVCLVIALAVVFGWL